MKLNQPAQPWILIVSVTLACALVGAVLPVGVAWLLQTSTSLLVRIGGFGGAFSGVLGFCISYALSQRTPPEATSPTLVATPTADQRSHDEAVAQVRARTQLARAWVRIIAPLAISVAVLPLILRTITITSVGSAIGWIVLCLLSILSGIVRISRVDPRFLRIRTRTIFLLTFVISIAAAGGYYMMGALRAMRSSTTYNVDRGDVFLFLIFTFTAPVFIMVLLSSIWGLFPTNRDGK